MKLRQIIAVLGLITLHGVADLHAQAAATGRGLQSYQLGNGLTVLLRPDYGEAAVTISVAYGAASDDEERGQRCVAHLLEHLTFRGTAQHPDMLREITLHSAEPSATTPRTATHYYLRVPPTMAAIDWALSLEASRMREARLDSADLERERRIVQDEVGGRVNHAEDIVLLLSGEIAAPRDANLATVDLRTVREFYDRYYRPDNALLIVEGNFTPDSVLPLIRQHFGVADRGSGIARGIADRGSRIAVGLRGRDAILRVSGPTSRIVAAYTVPAPGHPDFAAIRIALAAYTAPGGALDRVAKAGANDARVSWRLEPTRRADPALITIDFGDQTVSDSLLSDIRAQLDRFNVARLDDARVSDARKRAIASTDLTSSVALATCHAAVDWRLCPALAHWLDSLSPDAVNRAAETWLVPHNRTLVISEIAPNQDPIAMPGGDRRALLAAADSVAHPTRFTGEPFDPSLPAIVARFAEDRSTAWQVRVVQRLLPEHRIAGSLTVVWDLPQPEARVLELELAARAIARRASAARPRLQAMAAQVSIVSLPHPSIVLQDPFIMLDQLSKPIIGAGLGINFEAPREQLSAVFGILRELLADHADDKQAPGVLKKRMGTSSSVRTLVVRDSGASSPTPARSPSRTLVLVGDITIAESVRLARLLGTTTLDGYTAPLEPGTMPDSLRFFWDTVVPVDMTDPDYASLFVANRIIGSGISSRLFTRLRQELGISYAVSSRLRPVPARAALIWSVEVTYEAKNRAGVHAAIREILRGVLESGFTSEEVELAKASALGRFLISRGDADGLAETLVAWTPQQLLAFEQRLRALDANAVNQAFRKHIRLPEPRSL